MSLNNQVAVSKNTSLVFRNSGLILPSNTYNVVIYEGSGGEITLPKTAESQDGQSITIQNIGNGNLIINGQIPDLLKYSNASPVLEYHLLVNTSISIICNVEEMLWIVIGQGEEPGAQPVYPVLAKTLYVPQMPLPNPIPTDTYDNVIYTGTGAITMNLPAPATDGMILNFQNLGSGNLSIQTVNNIQITNGALVQLITVLPNNNTSLVYNATTSIWYMNSHSGTGGGGGGGVSNLQQAYDNSSHPEIVLKSSPGGLTIKDATPALNNKLFEVIGNNNANYFSVSQTSADVSGQLNVTKTTDQLILGSTTINAPNTGKKYNIPDVTTGSAFVMSSGAQTINDTKTFSALTLGGNLNANNQSLINIANISVSQNAEFKNRNITLGTYSPANNITLSAAAPGIQLVYTIPNVGMDADFVMNKENQTIDGVKTFSALALSGNLNANNQSLTNIANITSSNASINNVITVGKISPVASTNSVIFGYEAAKTNVGNNTIAIGYRAGYNYQSTEVIPDDNITYIIDNINENPSEIIASSYLMAIGFTSIGNLLKTITFISVSPGAINLSLFDDNNGVPGNIIQTIYTGTGTIDIVTITVDNINIPLIYGNKYYIVKDAGFNMAFQLIPSSSVLIGLPWGSFTWQSNIRIGVTGIKYPAIAIGYQAGLTSQNGIAVGYNSGQSNQGLYSIAIGDNAGKTSQGNKLYLNPDITYVINNLSNPIAGYSSNATSIVYYNTNTNSRLKTFSFYVNGTGSYTISLGWADITPIPIYSGTNSSGQNLVTANVDILLDLGFYYLEFNGSNGAETAINSNYISLFKIGISNIPTVLPTIAIGNNAGQTSQGGIAIGSNAAFSNQSIQAVAIGNNSGQSNQGQNAVAIGYLAGANSQASNSIIINASGVELNSDTTGTFIDPLQSAATSNVVFYNTISKELTYSNAGVVTTTGDQTINGQKTFTDNITIGSGGSASATLGYSSSTFTIEAVTTSIISGQTPLTLESRDINDTPVIYYKAKIGESGYALYVYGDAYKTTGTENWVIGSDIRLKENITDADLDICWNTVKNLKLKRYNYKENTIQNKDKNIVGWIADEVETVLPKAVQKIKAYGYDDLKTLDSSQIYRTMYGALQKAMQKIESLEQKVSDMQTQINNLTKS